MAILGANEAINTIKSIAQAPFNMAAFRAAKSEAIMKQIPNRKGFVDPTAARAAEKHMAEDYQDAIDGMVNPERTVLYGDSQVRYQDAFKTDLSKTEAMKSLFRNTKSGEYSLNSFGGIGTVGVAGSYMVLGD